ncbi:hypothetical protein FOL47_010672, partial [Perkinsus chesapeaki]
EDRHAQTRNGETLQAQYELVRGETDLSHVMQYGDQGFTKDQANEFMGTDDGSRMKILGGHPPESKAIVESIFGEFFGRRTHLHNLSEELQQEIVAERDRLREIKRTSSVPAPMVPIHTEYKKLKKEEGKPSNYAKQLEAARRLLEVVHERSRTMTIAEIAGSVVGDDALVWGCTYESSRTPQICAMSMMMVAFIALVTGLEPMADVPPYNGNFDSNNLTDNETVTNAGYYGKPDDCSYDKKKQTFTGSCDCPLNQDRFAISDGDHGYIVCTPDCGNGPCPSLPYAKPTCVEKLGRCIPRCTGSLFHDVCPTPRTCVHYTVRHLKKIISDTLASGMVIGHTASW